MLSFSERLFHWFLPNFFMLRGGKKGQLFLHLFLQLSFTCCSLCIQPGVYYSSGFLTSSWDVGKGNSRAECHLQGMGELWIYRAHPCPSLTSLDSLFFRHLWQLLNIVLMLLKSYCDNGMISFLSGNSWFHHHCCLFGIRGFLHVHYFALPLWYKGRWDLLYCFATLHCEL